MEVNDKLIQSYTKWINDAIEEATTNIDDIFSFLGDPYQLSTKKTFGFKTRYKSEKLNKSINNISQLKKKATSRIEEIFKDAQDRGYGDLINNIYQESLDKVNSYNSEGISLYETQLKGLQNIEKYKEGTKAFDLSYEDIVGRQIAKQEIEIDRIWDAHYRGQQDFYDDYNDAYTKEYYPEINERGYYSSEKISPFADEDIIAKYNELKNIAPDMKITKDNFDWETNIEKAHEEALEYNERFDQSGKKSRTNEEYKQQKELEKQQQRRYEDGVRRRNARREEMRQQDRRRNTNATPETTSQSTSTNVEVDEGPTQNTQPNPGPEAHTSEPETSRSSGKGYESRSKTFDMDDGSVIKQYYDKDGNIRAQVREWKDGRREVRRQHTAQTIKKDPLAKTMSAVVSNYDGNTTTIHRRPNGKYFSETTINHKTGEVVSTRSQRNSHWGGGVIGRETHRTTIKDLRDAHIEKINKKYNLDGHTTAVETGVDDSIHIQNNRNISSKYKNKRQRGRTGTGQATGRGNKKINRNILGRGRTSAGGVEPKGKARRIIKKGSEFGRGGKPTKFRPIGRNGKPISSIPRRIPTSKKDLIKTAANLIINETVNETAEQVVNNINLGNTADDFDNFEAPDFDIPNGYDSDPSTWTDEDIRDMADGDPDLYQELLNQREQARNGGGGEGGDTNTDSNKFANDPNDPTTWSDDYIEEMSEGDPHYYEELRQRREKAFEEAINSQGPKPPGPFSDGFDPNDPSTWTDNDRRRMNTPDQWTDDDIRRLADGDMDRANELNRMRNGEFGPYGHNPINDFDFDDAPIPDTSYKHAPDTEILDNSISTKTLSKMDIAMTGFNIIGAIGDYKSYRREGDGVISAGIKTGAKFAIEEALGFWALPIALVKSVPGMAIKGADALYKENRRMNSAANFTLFGDAQFMDTQQLATMRQSGMEMAKMSQYNLQQTLMGNEATYLHR